ncbi:unnamed protein product, partial [Effrenium voratum]
DEGEKVLLLKQLTELDDLLRLQSQLVELERQKACPDNLETQPMEQPVGLEKSLEKSLGGAADA